MISLGRFIERYRKKEKLKKYMDGFEDFSGYIYYQDGGNILMNRSYGYSDYENKIKHSIDTKFKIGSLTKQFTALSVLILQKRGKLKIEDSISKYIPDYPDADNIKIYHLLNMTAGIPNYWNDIMYSYYNFPNRYLVYSEEKDTEFLPTEIIDRFKIKPKLFEPGTRCEYSNSNYFLLGHIIEKVSGIKYEKFLEDNVLVPLGLKDTGYDYEKEITNKSIGYEKIKPEVKLAPSYNNSLMFSTGGIYSTVSDLLKWFDYVLENNILEIERNPKERDFCKNMSGSNYTYCNGLIIDNCSNAFVAEHEGMGPGYISYMYINEDQGKRLLILSNNEEYYYNFSRFYRGILDK